MQAALEGVRDAYGIDIAWHRLDQQGEALRGGVRRPMIQRRDLVVIGAAEGGMYVARLDGIATLLATLIKPGDALPVRLRDFGMLVADECAEVVRGFKNGSQRDAADSINEVFGE